MAAPNDLKNRILGAELEADTLRRQEQWELQVPDELREVLIFQRADHDSDFKRDAAKYPSRMLWEWAAADLRRVQTLYALTRQLHAQWCSEWKSRIFVATAPVHLVLHPTRRYQEEGCELLQGKLPAVYTDLFRLWRRFDGSLGPWIGEDKLDARLSQYEASYTENRVSRYGLTPEVARLLSTTLDGWNAHASKETLRKTGQRAFQQLCRPLPNLYATLTSMYDIGVRQVRVIGVFDTLAYNHQMSPVDHLFRGSIFHNDGSKAFEIHVYVDPLAKEPLHEPFDP